MARDARNLTYSRSSRSRARASIPLSLSLPSSSLSFSHSLVVGLAVDARRRDSPLDGNLERGTRIGRGPILIIYSYPLRPMERSKEREDFWPRSSRGTLTPPRNPRSLFRRVRRTVLECGRWNCEGRRRRCEVTYGPPREGHSRACNSAQGEIVSRGCVFGDWDTRNIGAFRRARCCKCGGKYLAPRGRKKRLHCAAANHGLLKMNLLL